MYPRIGIGYWIGLHSYTLKKIIGHQEKGSHKMELGIVLGHNRWFMDKMIIRVYKWCTYVLELGIGLGYIHMR